MERRDPPAGTNLAFVEALYASYLEDPSSVDADWQSYFATWAAEDGDAWAARRSVDGRSTGNRAARPSQRAARAPLGR